MEQKHTPQELAAEEIAFAVWPKEQGFTKDKWIDHKIEEFSGIISKHIAAGLLAAAPTTTQQRDELLELIQAVYSSHERHGYLTGKIIDRIEAAIAKASPGKEKGK